MNDVRHLKIVRITGALLLEILKTSGPRVLQCEGVPPDARVVRLGWDAERDVVFAIFEHDSFPECREEEIPSDLIVICREYFGREAVDVLTSPVLTAKAVEYEKAVYRGSILDDWQEDTWPK